MAWTRQDTNIDVDYGESDGDDKDYADNEGDGDHDSDGGNKVATSEVATGEVDATKSVMAMLKVVTTVKSMMLMMMMTH